METAINLLERRGALVPPKMAIGQQQASRQGSAARSLPPTGPYRHIKGVGVGVKKRGLMDLFHQFLFEDFPNKTVWNCLFSLTLSVPRIQLHL